MVGFLRGRVRMRVLAGRGGGRRVTVVVLALLALQVGSLVAPAHACGCGALLPGDQQRVSVGREVSLVRWDGRQEQIVMSLTVSTRPTAHAARPDIVSARPATDAACRQVIYGGRLREWPGSRRGC